MTPDSAAQIRCFSNVLFNCPEQTAEELEALECRDRLFSPSGHVSEGRPDLLHGSGTPRTRARLECVCLSGGGRTCVFFCCCPAWQSTPPSGGEGRPTQKELKRRRCHMTEVLFHCSSHFRERRPSDGFPLRLADFGGKLYNSEVFRSALNGNFGARAIDIFFSLSLSFAPSHPTIS